MIPWYSVEQTITAQQSLEIRCARCGHAPTPARAQDQKERFLFLFCIPLFQWTTTSIECTKCHKRVASSVRVCDLVELTADEIGEQISQTATSFEWGVAIIGGVVGIVPLGGWFIALIALAITWRGPRWIKFLLVTSIFIGIVLSVVLLMNP